MFGQSLGLIETIGLSAAIVAADAAMKSANVRLVGYELTKGDGMVTVKFEGEVGAVNAAVSAGILAARRAGQVYAHKVIARTAEDLDSMIHTAETVGLEPAEPDVFPPAQSLNIPVVTLEENPAASPCENSVELSEAGPQPTEEDKSQPVDSVSNKKKTPHTAGKKKR